MPNARDRIRMSDAEVQAFLNEEPVLLLATNGPNGWPHIAPLDYLVVDGTPAVWTYASSQKVKNLERDPRGTVCVEAGREYDELRGVMISGDVTIERDLEPVTEFGRLLAARRLGVGPAELPPDAADRVSKQSPKRVVLRIHEHSRATWDHRKLAGSAV